MTADFYDLLDVPPDASQDEITTAYREKVRIYHPDVNDDERARSQFTAVHKAREILGDPVERQAYDRLGHEEYVAKRTSGLPSPDVWEDTAGSSTESDDASDTTETASAASSSANAATESSGRTDGSETRSRSTGSRSDRSNASTAAGANATGGSARSSSDNRSASRGSTASSGATAGSAETASESAGRTKTSEYSDKTADSTRYTRQRSTDGSDSSRTGATAGRRQDGSVRSALVRWWRRRNVALPLIWLSVLVYGVGLAQFVLANEGGIGTVRSELALVGLDPSAVWAVLSGGRYGIETPAAFVSSAELVSPPLALPEWYAVLAGIVGVSLAVAAAIRIGWREDSVGPISMAETMLVASALAISTGLLGGPLLSGAVLMPFLFGIVVYHTRRGAGWTPSYLYVVPVLAPIGGLVAGGVGYAALPVDLLAFAALPMIGALGLPLRATIRKHFDL